MGGTDVNTASSEASVGLAVRFVRLLSYLTIQSNLLVLALSVSLAATQHHPVRQLHYS
jgi:hypothetical protein